MGCKNSERALKRELSWLVCRPECQGCGLISGQVTHRKQPVKACVSGITNHHVSLSLPLLLSQRNNTSIKKIGILNEKQVRHKIKSKILVHYIVLV